MEQTKEAQLREQINRAQAQVNACKDLIETSRAQADDLIHSGDVDKFTALFTKIRGCEDAISYGEQWIVNAMGQLEQLER